MTPLKNSRFAFSFLSILTLVLTSGCLKTRAQLRQDNEIPDQVHVTKSAPNEAEPAQPTGGYALDEIKNEIIHLTGRIEELERTTAEQQKNKDESNPKEAIKKLDARVAELEAQQADLLEQIQKLKTAPITSEIPEAFEKGKSQYAAGDFAAAIEQFTNYLRNPRAKHLQEATFMRAESFYALKQYRKAIADYSKIHDEFPNGKHAAQASLKLGQSFEALNMREDAKAFYQECAEKFPKTAEGKKAKAKIK